MSKIKELIKHKKRGITVEEDAKPSALVGKQVVLTIKHIGKEEPKVVEKPKKQKERPPMSPLQKLAAIRNWDKLQIEGSIRQLQQIRGKLANVKSLQYVYQNGLDVIKQELLTVLDLKWEADKRAYLLAVEQEAFAKYPVSFRGSPAEINKRLDITKAQEEF